MSENQYPISPEDQLKIWDECWNEALEQQKEYVYTLSMTQVMFAYRIGILSNRVIDHDMLNMDEDIPILDEDDE